MQASYETKCYSKMEVHEYLVPKMLKQNIAALYKKISY